MGGMSGLMGSSDTGSSSSSSSKTKTRTKVEMPTWIESVQKDMLSRANALSQENFTAYEGDRVADLTADELASFQMVRDMMGKQQGSLDTSKQGLLNYLNTAQNGFSQSQLETYMNPYTSNVMDISKRRSIEEFDRQKRDLAANAAQTAAFGGSRYGLAEANLYKNFGQQLQDAEYQQLYDNYNQALGAAERGAARELQGSLSLADLAAATQRYQMGDAAALEGVGRTQRQVSQAELDAAYEEFIREQAFPYQQLEFLSGISNPLGQLYRGQVSVTKGTSNTVGTNTEGNSGSMGAGLGLGAIGAGMGGAGTSGGFNLSNLGGIFSSMGGGAGTIGGGGMFDYSGGSSTGLSQGSLNLGGFGAGSTGGSSGGGGWGGAASGAVSGASMGSSFGPWGALAGGVLGGVMGYFKEGGVVPSYSDGGPNLTEEELAQLYYKYNPLEYLSSVVNTGGKTLRGVIQGTNLQTSPENTKFQNDIIGLKRSANQGLAATGDVLKLPYDLVEQYAPGYFVESEKVSDAKNQLKNMDAVYADQQRQLEAALGIQKQKKDQKQKEDVAAIQSLASLIQPTSTTNPTSNSATPTGFNPAGQKQLDQVFSQPSPTSSGTTEEKKGGINYPLVAFGASMLASNKGFLRALGESTLKGIEVKQGEDKIKQAQKVAEQEMALNTQKVANETMLTQAQMANYESQIKEREIVNPYKGQKQQLEMQKLMNEVANNTPQSKQAALAVDLIKANPGPYMGEGGTQLAMQEAGVLLSRVQQQSGATQAAKPSSVLPPNFVSK